jgi:hypothetical protein
MVSSSSVDSLLLSINPTEHSVVPNLLAASVKLSTPSLLSCGELSNIHGLSQSIMNPMMFWSGDSSGPGKMLLAQVLLYSPQLSL